MEMSWFGPSSWTPAACSSRLNRFSVHLSALSISWMSEVQQSVRFLHLSVPLSVWPTGRLSHLIFPSLFCLIGLPHLSIFSGLSRPACQTSDLRVPVTSPCLCPWSMFFTSFPLLDFLEKQKVKVKLDGLDMSTDASLVLRHQQLTVH